MKSMTGYGLGEVENDNYYIKVEMKSVNHRYCDINLRMPRILFSIEDQVKRQIKERVSRGKIDVYINLTYLSSKGKTLEVDLDLAQKYYHAAQKIKDHLKLEDHITIGQLLRTDGIILEHEMEEGEEELHALVFEALEKALNAFLTMREREGENLKKDFKLKLNKIFEIANCIQKKAPKVLEENQEKLRLKIAENVKEDELDLPRLTTEIVLMMDKLSIDEEVTRLNLHIDQFNDIMSSSEPVGRKLDFLLQELNRETNTIGSKTSDMDILNWVVDLKTEIEKLREQIQNIE
ncbi:MAG: YicC/YloC family endoribonuclease [Tissierellia bacterium]|nr:YicC/YloC family endoribonuclease [Tissierellia bacterium]